MIDSDTPAPDLIAAFERAAEAARRTEDSYRKEAAARIAALAGERVTAFRRLNLVRNAVAAIGGSEEADEAVAHARLAIARSLGWDEIGPRHELILDRLKPFLEALAAGSSAEAPPSDKDAAEALRDFENWYRSEIGSDFYALFDRYMPETPRVDF